MKLAVISDIHGNLEAFKQVLADIDRSGVDDLICLGDHVGYGPEPEKVVRRIRELNIRNVIGNHELGLIDKEAWDFFNPLAQKSLSITRKLISSGTLGYFKDLEPYLTLHHCRFVHGCPPDDIMTYLFEVSNFQLQGIFQAMRERLCFVGHTHLLKVIQFDGVKVVQRPLKQGTLALQEDMKYIINIGSVGQPRDGDSRAKYVIMDTDSQLLDVRFVPYDASATAAKIIELGFPDIFAKRLF
ncbi:MAG: metallophosphoesterase family protein [Deltaproteobacteria bacterium]|nr:metallophosphoesterase family protein [Deltaproteobacteria bacterium]MBW2052311.1 metallophosphoesterase family protein [Deltaproteobacteria bacterium]MBW2139768.1 metallophosphoesterase family protein [Deltaproteobacteria bacterium]MBW2323014.1 metallophosphoesterase family protein [Deltaproteobacteria bacterium]